MSEKEGNEWEMTIKQHYSLLIEDQLTQMIIISQAGACLFFRKNKRERPVKTEVLMVSLSQRYTFYKLPWFGRLVAVSRITFFTIPSTISLVSFGHISGSKERMSSKTIILLYFRSTNYLPTVNLNKAYSAKTFLLSVF